jgi:hypothetical protein
MAEYERFFYYEPADYVACEEHMGGQLAAWFPETSDKVGPSLWGTWDVDSLVPALLESGELLETQFTRLGVRMGPVERNCMSLH